MNPRPPSIYNESHSRKPFFRSPGIFLGQLVLMIIVLLGIRFVNTALLWHINKSEIVNNTITQGEGIRFVGFSTYNAAKKDFMTESQLNPHGTQITCFYSFFHPMIFLINKQDTRTFLELGRFDTVLKTGLTEITIFTSEIIRFQHGHKVTYKYIGNSLLKSMFAAMATKRNQKEGEGPPFSFILKPLEKSKYLKTPYLIYFFLPLIIIILLSQHYGIATLFAFIYYLEAFFLFDLKAFFVVGPFSWLFKFLGLEVSSLLVATVSILSVVIFLFFTFKGMAHMRNKGKNHWEKFFILLFIFIPFFLRF